MGWCGFSFHWNASLSESSLWHQKWLLSRLSARQGLNCYFSYVWFSSNFSNSVFQLLWISLSIFTCCFEEQKSFATLFRDGKCCWKDEDKETDLGMYCFLHFSKISIFHNFLFVCLPLESSQETSSQLLDSLQIFCCSLKKTSIGFRSSK